LHTYSGTGLKTRLRNGARYAVRLLDCAGKIVGTPPIEEIANRLLGRSVTPLITDYWKRYPKGLNDFVAKLAACYPWKAVIVEYIWLHQATNKLNKDILRLLDTHDIQYKRVEEFASRGMKFPLQITREEESLIFNQFHAVIAIQAVEAAAIKEMCPQLKVLTVGSSGSTLTVASSRPVEGRILYVGGYNGANVDGLRRFLNSVWPRIRAQNPSATLRICGYINRAFLRERFENVSFLGHKECIEEEYAETALVINPAWIGTGLKIKSIEALAHGKALITTSKGIEGLPKGVEKCTLVTDDDEKFAAELNRLLTDKEARQSLAQSAVAFADTFLNKRAVYEELFYFLNFHLSTY
jgi:glycosyltransferase involved in cell wall biosynthesis